MRRAVRTSFWQKTASTPKRPRADPLGGTQGEEATAQSSLTDWRKGYLQGLALGVRVVRSAGLGDKGAEIITQIADLIVMLGGVNDDDRAQEYAFWHVDGLEASEGEHEAARKIYERPDDELLLYAETLAELRASQVGMAAHPENTTD